MKRILLPLLLALAAVVPLATAAPASAANCTLPAGSPQAPYQGPDGAKNLPVSMNCSAIDAIQIDEDLFIGGSTLGWSYGPFSSSTTDSGLFGPGGSGLGNLSYYCETSCSVGFLDTVYQCQSSGGYSYDWPNAYWWGHEVAFRIHNVNTHTWGSWTQYSVASGGDYDSFLCD